MRKAVADRRYIRLGPSMVQAITYKVGSTSIIQDLQGPCTYDELKKGDHVILYVRDPRDRLLSAWRWFTGPHNCYIKDILEKSPQDHDFILDARSPFKQWVYTALRHWNPHWAPQSEIHPRWREFELRDLVTYSGSFEKKTRDAAERAQWESYYDEELLALVDEIYAEDLEMWKEVSKNGTDTGTNRIL